MPSFGSSVVFRHAAIPWKVSVATTVILLAYYECKCPKTPLQVLLNFVARQELAKRLTALQR